MQFFIAFWHNDLRIMRSMDKRHFDIRQMESFAAVMSTGSMTAAARLTGRSQPAVTRLVQELEADVGFSLLHRSGPRITPTPNGVRFHRDVERALLCFEQMRARADAIAQGHTAPLAIAAIPALADKCLSLIGAATAGSGLFLTGLILSAQPIRITREVTIGAVLKNVLQPLLALLLVWLLRLPQPIAGEAVLLIAIPAGFFGLVFGAGYGSRPAVAGSTLVVSSVASVVTLAIAVALMAPHP